MRRAASSLGRVVKFRSLVIFLIISRGQDAEAVRDVPTISGVDLFYDPGICVGVFKTAVPLLVEIAARKRYVAVAVDEIT